MSSASKRPSSVLENDAPPETAKQQKKDEQYATADEFYLSILNMPDPDPAAVYISEWRVIPTLPGYEASATGKIRIAATKKTVPQTYVNGRRLVSHAGQRLVNHVGMRTAVDVLVCLAFRGLPPSSFHTVRHKNGDKQDNSEINLEWVISAEQMYNAGDVKVVNGRLRAVVQTRHTWKQTVFHRSVGKAAKVAHCSIGKMLKMCESGEFVGGSTWAFQDLNMS
jgi:hypothetical protein